MTNYKQTKKKKEQSMMQKQIDWISAVLVNWYMNESNMRQLNSGSNKL